MIKPLLFVAIFALTSLSIVAQAAADKPKNPNFDADLSKKLGADERGMKMYVMAILKEGPNKAPAGVAGQEFFKGHFANINRLAKEGKLLVAGPFDDKDSNWAGMFIFDVTTVDDAKALTATDPTIKAGVFVPEFHLLYCSAALMEISRIHGTLSPTLP